MARITPYRKVTVTDQRGATVNRHAGPLTVSAQASQVGHGVRVHIPPAGLVMSRLDWEIIKSEVDQAFKDDEEIPIKNPLW